MLKWLIWPYWNSQNWFHVKSEWQKNASISTPCTWQPLTTQPSNIFWPLFTTLLRRVLCWECLFWFKTNQIICRFYAKLTELRNRIRNNTSTATSSGMTTTVPVRSMSTSKPYSNTISLNSSNNNNLNSVSESHPHSHHHGHGHLSSVAENTASVTSTHDSLSPNEDSSLSSTTSTNSSDASWSASR